MDLKYILLIPISFLFLFVSCQKETIPQLSDDELRLPKNAIKGLSVGEGLNVQLFAAEPLVRNPSNIDIDYQGRIWVVENVNYRPENNPDNEYQEGGDQINILTDEDGDGQADSKTIFYQGEEVEGAMGICLLDHQLILSSSPHIYLLSDTNRDDKADKIEKLFSGLGYKQGDHNVHAAITGPDQKLYFNFGNGSGQIYSSDSLAILDKWGREIRSNGKPYWGGMVLRCNLDGSELEVLGHNFRNNYEVGIDSYGTLWQSDNDDDGNKSVRINYVMEFGNFGYLDELTGESWQVPRSGMSNIIQERHWHQNDPGVVPNILITGSGSPTGICVYEGTQLPAKYYGQLLHADAGPGTIRGYLLQKDGAGYKGSIDNVLIRKLDSWYRPTDVAVAPDGSVFIADWYDPGVGGHLAGDNLQGRIYRISSKTNSYIIDQAEFITVEKAAAALASPNPHTQFLARKSLLTFGKQSQEVLTEIWESQEDSRLRARALWLLGKIDPSYIPEGIKDQEVDIRITSIRLARQEDPQHLLEHLQMLVTDSSSAVRREVAIALRESTSPQAVDLWVRLANQYDGKDKWYLEALGIGAMDKWERCFSQWMASAKPPLDTKAGKDILRISRTSKTLDYLVDILSDPTLDITSAASYLRATDFQSAPDKDKKLSALFELERDQRTAFQKMLLTHINADYAKNSSLVQKAVHNILPGLEGTEDYLDMIDKLELALPLDKIGDLLKNHSRDELGAKTLNLLLKRKAQDYINQNIRGSDETLALATIEVLGNLLNSNGKEILVAAVSDEQLDIQRRSKALGSLSKDWGWEGRVIRLLDQEELPDELVKQAATSLLGAFRPVDREVGMKYLEQFGGGASTFAAINELIGKEGDVTKGRLLFKQNCSSCHITEGEGINFGPELSEIGNKLGKDALYGAIIFPNAGISHGFEGIIVEKTNGEFLSGYMLSENTEKIDLRLNGGINQSILKTDIKEIRPMGMSLMPTGLHLALKEEGLVDVVEYLASMKSTEKQSSNPYQGKLYFE